MADPNNSPLHVDCVNADGIENLPNEDNKLCYGNVEFLGTVPLKLNAECDITFSESVKTLEPPNGSEKLSGIDTDSAKLNELIADESNFSDNVGVTTCNFSEEIKDAPLRDEEFHDAVEFFKDPSSFTFLENAGSSSNPDLGPSIVRSSLYINFDPLHAKYALEPVKSNELHEVLESKTSEVISADQEKENSREFVKHFNSRQSLGKSLITFESPISSNHFDKEELKSNSEKRYTEEELQQELKIKELTLFELFIKKEQELEKKVLHAESIVKEVYDEQAVKEKALEEKIHILEQENSKLKEDLKIAVENLEKKESTFADDCSHYIDMLKGYTENEKSLKQQIGSLKQSNMEATNSQKITTAEKEFYREELKKAVAKISILENDVNRLSTENEQLINSNEMSKVSEALP